MTQERKTLSSSPTSDLRLGVFTRRLQENIFVSAHFNSQHVRLKPSAKHADEIDLVIGWGRKSQALKAFHYAEKHSLPFATLEDGFIHSMSQGRLGASSWSLVVDKLGIFYDASTSSSLEKSISNNKLSPEQRSRASLAINTITQHGITKYNNAKLVIPADVQKLRNTVLVVDQVWGDMSIPYSLANKQSFDLMLEAALTENPDSDILVKTHPDVTNGRRRGCISLPKELPQRVHITSENLNPIFLLKHIKKVYVVSSQLGFEALLMDKPVVCFGVPFYAAWGLTDDRLISTSAEVFKRRKKKVDLQTIFYATYIEYSNYFHPDTQRPCELEDILNYTKLQYKVWKEHAGKIFCIGFSPWKKRFITSYLKTPDNDVFFAASHEEAKAQGFDRYSKACLWSSRYESEAERLHADFQTPIWRVEDGFIRSISLGSNYSPPASLVIDKQGLYFNPEYPSDLEEILQTADFTSEQLNQAQALKRQLIKQAISKYNVGSRGLENLFQKSGEKRKLLIPGQVSDDASILKGCQDINSNAELIKTVRENHPDAFLIYKPHPDVLSGNRKGQVDESILATYCDQVVIDVSITDCLEQVDEIHTMTSLVGFEGLMRGLKVYCYGIPFYSNWGLTTDRHRCDRRTRQLTINQLIAGTLLEYPLYMNWDSNSFTTAPHVANTIHDHLLQSSDKTYSCLPPPYLKKLRRKLNLLATMLRPTLK